MTLTFDPLQKGTHRNENLGELYEVVPQYKFHNWGNS